MNLFDGLQSVAFAVVTNTMGYAVNWTPAAGGSVITAKVLFKDASETAKAMEVEYDPRRAMMEYFETDLPGLEASVKIKNNEFVFINGIQFGVNEVKAEFDGKTLRAQLMQI